jgi:hypothetical protein
MSAASRVWRNETNCLASYQFGNGVTGFVVAQTFVAATATVIARPKEKETKNWSKMAVPEVTNLHELR